MTEQEAYEAARVWVGREGATPCWDDEAQQCVYWRPDGNRCAIGGILTLETAQSLQDNDESVGGIVQGPHSTRDTYPYDVAEPGAENGELQGLRVLLLQELQKAHDDHASEAISHDDFGDAYVEKDAADVWQRIALRKMDEAARRFDLKVV